MIYRIGTYFENTNTNSYTNQYPHIIRNEIFECFFTAFAIYRYGACFIFDIFHATRRMQISIQNRLPIVRPLHSAAFQLIHEKYTNQNMIFKFRFALLLKTYSQFHLRLFVRYPMLHRIRYLFSNCEVSLRVVYAKILLQFLSL